MSNLGNKTTNFAAFGHVKCVCAIMLSQKQGCRPSIRALPAEEQCGRRAERIFSMNWPWRKKKLSFAETAKFNWEADTNAELRQKLNELAKQYPTLPEREYKRRLLLLFRERGLDINAEQLDMLLLLRQKTDQMLLDREAGRQENTTRA